MKIYYTIGIDYNENFDSDLVVNEDAGKQVYVYVINGERMETVLELNVKFEDNTLGTIQFYADKIKEKLGLDYNVELTYILL